MSSIYELRREQVIARPLADVFDFFARPENLEKITPPWLRFRILTPLPIAMQQGALIRYALRLRGLPIRWLTEIEAWNPPFEFVDVQRKGPYRLWRHTHRFAAVEQGTVVTDIVEYALPFGVLGRAAHGVLVARDLSRIFDYRAERVKALL